MSFATTWLFLLPSAAWLLAVDQGVVNRSSEPGADGHLPKAMAMTLHHNMPQHFSILFWHFLIFLKDYLFEMWDPPRMPPDHRTVPSPVLEEVQVADAETAAALVLAACHSLVATLEMLNDQLIRLFDQKLSSICKMLFLLRDQNRHNRPNSQDIPKLLGEIKPASTGFNLSEDGRPGSRGRQTHRRSHRGCSSTRHRLVLWFSGATPTPVTPVTPWRQWPWWNSSAGRNCVASGDAGENRSWRVESKWWLEKGEFMM